MTDERYVFMQDLKEKNSTKSGAYHKRSGKRSHYVGLPSDHMTPAQLKRRNGPVKTYSINTCIRDYEEFKELPADLKKAYVIGCRDTYGAMAPAIAEAMGINPVTLRKNLINSGISVGGKGGRHKLDPRWEEFVAGFLSLKGEDLYPDRKEPEEIIEVSPAPVILDKPELIAKPEINPYRCTISMQGTPQQLADLIAVLTDRATSYDFSVTIVADNRKEGD